MVMKCFNHIGCYGDGIIYSIIFKIFEETASGCPAHGKCLVGHSIPPAALYETIKDAFAPWWKIIRRTHRLSDYIGFHYALEILFKHSDSVWTMSWYGTAGFDLIRAIRKYIYPWCHSFCRVFQMVKFQEHEIPCEIIAINSFWWFRIFPIVQSVKIFISFKFKRYTRMKCGTCFRKSHIKQYFNILTKKNQLVTLRHITSAVKIFHKCCHGTYGVLTSGKRFTGFAVSIPVFDKSI